MHRQLTLLDLPSVTNTAPTHSGPVSWRLELRLEQLAARIHPTSGLPLAGNGETCSGCAHRVPKQLRSGRRVWKCELSWDPSDGPSIKGDAPGHLPACEQFRAA